MDLVCAANPFSPCLSMKRALNTLFLDRQGEKAITGIPTEDFDHDTVQNHFSPCLSMKRALNTFPSAGSRKRTSQGHAKVPKSPGRLRGSFGAKVERFELSKQPVLNKHPAPGFSLERGHASPGQASPG